MLFIHLNSQGRIAMAMEPELLRAITEPELWLVGGRATPPKWIIYGYGWWFQPLRKIWKSIGMMKFPTEWNNKSHVPNHQPDDQTGKSIKDSCYYPHVGINILLRKKKKTCLYRIITIPRHSHTITIAITWPYYSVKSHDTWHSHLRLKQCPKPALTVNGRPW